MEIRKAKAQLLFIKKLFLTFDILIFGQLNYKI